MKPIRKDYYPRIEAFLFYINSCLIRDRYTIKLYNQ